MIHVDISKILTSRRFQQRLRVAAAQLRSKIDLILAPNHFAARELAEQVRKALGITGERLLLADDTALQYLGTQAKQAIKKSKGLLIVDDVVITGDRFWSYRNALERAGLTAPQRPVHFLVGLERTPTKETLQGVCDAAHSVEHFHPIESLTLPNWGDDECPWCWEFAQLKKQGEGRGFLLVAASPLTRSSYHAGEDFERLRAANP